tara:strand:+ start:266 stop:736 length:471 start_codon:yes stop_codon:yes gene_type:complete
MIFVIYGQPGSGKTTLGRRLAGWLKTPFFIDGDEFRSLFGNVNYGKQGREINIRNANAVATFLSKRSVEWQSWTGEPHVVLGLVNPYTSLRDELVGNNPRQVAQILLRSSRSLRKDYHVEDFEKGEPNLVLNTDDPEDQSFQELVRFIDKSLCSGE